MDKTPSQPEARHLVQTMQRYSHGSYQLWFLWRTKHHIILWFDATTIQLLTTVARPVSAVLFWSPHPSVSLLPLLSHCHEAQLRSDFFTSSDNLVCVYNLLTHLQVGLHMLLFRSLGHVQAESKGTWLP